MAIPLAALWALLNPQQAQQAGNQVVGAIGLDNQQAPTNPGLNFDQANQSRGAQWDLLRQYQQMAAGQGPSLAQGQLQQATDQNISNAMALGAAQQGQGLGYASALRGIADQSAAARQQAAAQSAMLRNYEQMQAMGAQGELLGGVRGQDIGQTGMTGDQGYRYDSLQAQIDAQNRQRRAQFAGGVLNAVGGGIAQAGSAMGMGAGMAGGGLVPGYAQGGMPMDSQQNDTVPAMLSPGEIVLPRSVTMAPDAEKRAGAFVAAVLARRKAPQQSEAHPVVRQVAQKGAK